MKIKIQVLLLLIFANTTIFAQAPKGLPYYTGFDSPSEKLGWKEFRTGFKSQYGWGNQIYLSHDYNVGGNEKDTVVDWYVSPALDFKQKGKLSFKISVTGFSNPTPDNLELKFSSKNANPATGNYSTIANLSYTTKNKDTVISIDIPTTADSGFIAFKYKTIGAAWWTVRIDSITVKALASASVQQLKSEFSVYPNPSKGKIFIDFTESNVNSNYNLKIYNLLGQLMYNSKLNKASEINLNLPQSTYYYVIDNNNSKTISTGKLVIVE